MESWNNKLLADNWNSTVLNLIKISFEDENTQNIFENIRSKPIIYPKSIWKKKSPEALEFVQGKSLKK